MHAGLLLPIGKLNRTAAGRTPVRRGVARTCSGQWRRDSHAKPVPSRHHEELAHENDAATHWGCRAGGTDETGDYFGKVAQPLAIDGGVTSAGIWSGEGNGAQGRSRTTDTAIFSRMLYQLSYLGAPRRRRGL